MKTLKTAVAVAIGTLFAGAAFAQSDFGIERRDAYLDNRIDRGVETGRITPREATRLESQQERIERLEARARADGRLTGQERARIDHAQDRLSRDIHRESNDRQGTNGGRFGNNRGYYGGNYGHNNGGYYGHNNGGYYGHNNGATYGHNYGGTYGNIERRDLRQDARIDRGIASGQITSQEAARLEGNRARIERMETRARSDGHLSGQERARIDHAQDRLGRSITRQSNDNQTTASVSRVARADRPERVAQQTRSTTTPRVRTGGTRTDGERRNR